MINPRLEKSLQALARYFLLSMVAIVTAYPIWWLLTVSLKTREDYVAHPFSVPTHVVIDNFAGILVDGILLRFFLNSVIVTAVSVIIVALISTMAGYAIARFQFRGRNVLLLAFLLTNMIPVTMLIIPLFLILRWMHLLGGYTSLVISYVTFTMGLAVFLTRGFFRTVPQAFVDAGRLDGCSELQLFVRIMLPMAKAGVIVVSILNVITIWNEYFIALILVQDQSFYTIPLGLTVFRGKYDTDWPRLASALFLSSLPTLAMYFVFKEKIVAGLSRGLGK
jgi:raffinose/stachyose/melibiose transport system permease protein